MEKKKNKSMIRRLIHRSPQLSFGHQSASKESKARRCSDGMLTVPENYIAPAPMPSWYLKDIKTRDEAEELLNKQRVGTYLVRQSETSKLPGSYTLSLLHKDKCRHHKIETNPINNKLVIKGYKDNQFDDLENLVNFFVKSQKKDIHLTPFNPNAELKPAYEEMDGSNCHVHQVMDSGSTANKEDGVCRNEELKHAYEEMDGSNCHDKYQVMDSGSTAGSPPPLPTRRERQTSVTQSYVNLPSRDCPPPLPPQSSQGYENVPPKDSRSPLPPLPSPNSAPPLPPRVPPSSQGSYENIPGRPAPVSRNNANLEYENYLPQSSKAHSTPGHSYQNLPPKITPRKPSGKGSYSAEQTLPPRKPTVPLRRSVTDSPQDWKKRGYNM